MKNLILVLLLGFLPFAVVNGNVPTDKENEVSFFVSSQEEEITELSFSASESKSVILKNTGNNTPLTIKVSIEVPEGTSSAFSLEKGTCFALEELSLAKDAPCNVNINFTPQANESEATLKIEVIMEIGLEGVPPLLTTLPKKLALKGDAQSTEIDPGKEQPLELPPLAEVFSIPEGESDEAKFFGGISVKVNNNAGDFKTNGGTLKKGSDITIKGIIEPDQNHVGQADIIVVAFHRPDPTNSSCDPMDEPDGSGYYMLTNGDDYSDNYCIWDVDVPGKIDTFSLNDSEGKPICNRLEDGTVRPRRSERKEPVVERWEGNLGTLSPFDTKELQSEMPITLYEDTPSYQGHVCFYFGYRLDGTLVFNGDPIQFSVE